MKIEEMSNQPLWDYFIIAHGSQFLQSWDWGELQKKLNRKIWRLGFMENNQLVAAALIIKHQLPLGQSYLYCPRGPIVKDQIYLQPLLAEIKNIATAERATWLRLEPAQNEPWLPIGVSGTGGQRIKQTLILDLTPTVENLLVSFHQKTRYNIHLAEKHGVTICEGKSETDFEAFWDLLQKTHSKQQIKSHPKSYYHQILTANYPPRLGEAGQLPASTRVSSSMRGGLTTKLFIAEYQGQPVAANLCYYYGNTATYAHGGSDYEYRHLMAPYLLQWQQILDAKQNGYKHYDFWGIDEFRWPGVTRFKLGFGGATVSYPGVFDLAYSSWKYQIYRLIRKIR